jgi:hypothetical protein
MRKHCCERMSLELQKNCEVHDRYECPDSLIVYLPQFDEYGIIIHDGGSSKVRIEFCPWCGAKLAESKREQWVQELENRGIDPGGEAVPKAFESDEWYRGRG